MQVKGCVGTPGPALLWVSTGQPVTSREQNITVSRTPHSSAHQALFPGMVTFQPPSPHFSPFPPEQRREVRGAQPHCAHSLPRSSVSVSRSLCPRGLHLGLPFFPPSLAYLPWRCTRRSTRLKSHPAASLPRVPADRGARSQAASKATRRLLQGARAARSGDELPNLLAGCVGGGSTARGATLWDRTREGGPGCPAPRPPTHHHHRRRS